MNCVVRCGSIAAFSQVNESGSILPDEARPDGKKIIFQYNKNNLCVPYENSIGTIAIRRDYDVLEYPIQDNTSFAFPVTELKVGTRVVFDDSENSTLIHYWTLDSCWQQGVDTLLSRPNRQAPLVRVRKLAIGEINRSVVWEGYLDIFSVLATSGNGIISSSENIVFEWRLAHGWRRFNKEEHMELINRFGQHFDTSSLLRSMRFYLAYLLEKGLGVVKNNPTLAISSNIYVLSAIGRMRQKDGVKNFWGLGVDYVNGSHKQVSQLTNLDPNFLMAMNAKYPSFTWDEVEGIVYDLRRDEVSTSSLYQVAGSEMLA